MQLSRKDNILQVRALHHKIVARCEPAFDDQASLKHEVHLNLESVYLRLKEKAAEQRVVQHLLVDSDGWTKALLYHLFDKCQGRALAGTREARNSDVYRLRIIDRCARP